MRPIEDGDAEQIFVCALGTPQVDYLRDHALAAQRGDMCRTYVLPGDNNEPAIQGFYSICMGRVTSTDLPENKGKKGVPPTPAALLAQLARDDRALKGTGQELLLDALERILKVAEQIGCKGAFLHAQVPELVGFYSRAGFKRVGSSEATNPTLWLSMKDIRETFDQVAAEAPPEP
jgi:hypothetical protein